LSELADEGYVLREKEGRRNRYSIGPMRSLRHPLVEEREQWIGREHTDYGSSGCL